ncbi:hypothetical protein ACHAQH_000917 [Verticillium albo-atrum]
MYRLASEGPIDAIFSDHLAEVNIAQRVLEMMESPDLGYEQGFLTHLGFKTAAEEVVKRNIKLVHDGGALNPRGLYEATKKFLEDKGLHGVKIAWADGDNVTELSKANKSIFKHQDIPDVDTSSIKNEILSANAYIEMRGILSALNAGAQIVICWRCCDASPVMALSAWWHGWSLTDYDRLAGSLIAGHVTECGPYTTGGKFCGFKAIPKLWEVSYPITEVADDGSCVVTMHEGSNGAVTVHTVTAQLVYEIQGPTYLNPDVAAQLEDVWIENLGPNRVHVWGVRGQPPPPITKMALCTFGGYQAEISTYAVGLDVKGKAELEKKKVLGRLDASRFSGIAIDTYDSVPEDPTSQKDASVQIRHFVQAPTKEAIQEFASALFFCSMQGYGGFHLNMDMRTIAPKPYVRYFPGKIDQSEAKFRAHLTWDRSTVDAIPLPATQPFKGQRSYEPANPSKLASFAATKCSALGKVVLARSGDKGVMPMSDSGFMTIAHIKELLGDDYKPEYRVERFEMPGIKAVHFVVYGILEEGVSSSSLIDGFAKSVGEFVRARLVNMPQKFLDRPEVGDTL